MSPHWARLMPNALFLSPHAPFPCELGPWGRQWFSVADGDPVMLLAGTRAAAPILDGFIDSVLSEHDLTADRLALVGFSQGTMMALYVVPRRAAACAGVVGYSGRLIGADMLQAELKSRPPMLLFHGDADQVLPHESLPAAVEGLQAVGIEVEAHLRPGLGHAIDEEGLRRGGEFLADLFVA